MSDPRVREFIRCLAKLLAGPDQVEWSIKLQAGNKTAKKWAELRGWTPLFGYPTVDEAEKTLKKFLQGKMMDVDMSHIPTREELDEEEKDE